MQLSVHEQLEREAHHAHLAAAARQRALAQVRAATRKRDNASGLAVGSFSSLDSATRLVNSTLAQNEVLVGQVAHGTLPVKRVDAQFDSITGYEAYAPTERSQPSMRETFGVGVVIVHDPGSEKRFRILSAFPINRKR
jgi:hypothetical protein